MKNTWAIVVMCIALTLTACQAAPDSKPAAAPVPREEQSASEQAKAKASEASNKSSQTQYDENDVSLKISFDHGTPQSKRDEHLTLVAYNGEGKRITEFEDVHVDKMHLIVISRDLSVFQHIHPHLKENGEFMITTRFPKGGDYQLISTFVPTGMGKGKPAIVNKQWVHVEGEAPTAPPIQPDKELTKVVDGKKISLSFNKRKAGETVQLTYRFEDAQTKKPIHDLEFYIGSKGHVVIMSEDSTSYIHTHPNDEASTGPELEFDANFPKSGKYKIWAEFQREGKVFLVSFIVNIPE
ncbi:hypothetical protein [Paenibacillus turpanensis]|uniref:hypothetical protein n=1 Tax=Paenibacillus turpanensis TaxID=2689078 RepID=UPI0014090F2D|nr:hypothetical protein [Paenibacillus turpanensis]